MSLIKTNSGLWNKGLLPRTRFFDNFFDTSWPVFDSETENMNWMPAANVKETDRMFEIELSVPGYTKKDIHMEMNNDMLRITGEMKDEVKTKNDEYTRREFSYGSFTRTFHLPEFVKDDKITAKCKDGVLLVTLPKKEAAILKEKVKEIEIS